MISCPPLTRQTAARSSKTRAFVLWRNETVTINDHHMLNHLLSTCWKRMWRHRETWFTSCVFLNLQKLVNLQDASSRAFWLSQDHAALPQFNAIENMQNFKSQTAFVEIQANQRQLHNSGKGRQCQPLTACSPGEFACTNPKRRQFYTSQDHHTSAISLHGNTAHFTKPSF